jgi:type IV secretory pathway protease TraF
VFAVAFSISMLAWKPLIDPAPMMLWNVSASVPRGVYRIEKRRPIRGEIAVLHLPEWAALFASERRYLPGGAWLFKPVAATNGSMICRFGICIFVDGKLVTSALAADKRRRAMPKRRGCSKLKFDQFFLLSRHRDSFDSRHFGPVDGTLIVGTAKPILLVRP